MSPAPARTPRPGWTEYFFNLAALAASRATCPRAAVGAVLVDADMQILATGYNGAPRGADHCGAVCDLLDADGHCRNSVHAEANAVAAAARRGTALAGSVAYVSHRPCATCYLLLVQAGVTAVYYRTEYRPLPLHVELERRCGVRVEKR